MKLRGEKLDFNKKYFGVPLALILVLIVAGLVSAAVVVVYEASIQGRVEIEPVTGDNYEITIYEDEACTKELTFIDFGSIKPGKNAYSEPFYVKNTGDSYIPKFEVKHARITAEGWVELSGSTMGPLDVGEVMGICHAMVVAGADAQPGIYTGEIKIVCYGPES